MGRYDITWPPHEGPATGQLIPYYQPILALDTRRIMGYEALGRIQTTEGVRSLGPFFEDRTVPMTEQIRVDRVLREKALAKLAAADSDCQSAMLFLNLKPSWIYRTYTETSELPTLQLIEKYGISPSRVVIEITEEAFQGSMEQLRTVVDLYRKEGCLIAIDDVGSGFSNMDRIAQIQPNLLKLDIHLLQESEGHIGYYGVVRSFSTLAEQIGASLLVEGVETEHDLERAIEIGARYVQGYLFAPAEPEFRPSYHYASLIEAGLERRRSRMISEERYWSAEAEKLLAVVEASWRISIIAEDGVAQEAADYFIEELLPGLEASCIRVYWCREDGIQISSNYNRQTDGAWGRETAFCGSNWSWRPYFIPISVEMEGKPRALVSRTYTDINSGDRIRTISVPVGQQGIMFVDIIDPEGER